MLKVNVKTDKILYYTYVQIKPKELLWGDPLVAIRESLDENLSSEDDRKWQELRMQLLDKVRKVQFQLKTTMAKFDSLIQTLLEEANSWRQFKGLSNIADKVRYTATDLISWEEYKKFRHLNLSKSYDRLVDEEATTLKNLDDWYTYHLKLRGKGLKSKIQSDVSGKAVELEELLDRLSLAELIDRKYGLGEQAHTEAGPEKRGLDDDFKEKDRENNNNNNNNKKDAEEEKKPNKKVKSENADKPQLTPIDNITARTKLLKWDKKERRLNKLDYYSDLEDLEPNAIETDFKNMQLLDEMDEKLQEALKHKPATITEEKWLSEQTPLAMNKVKKAAESDQKQLLRFAITQWPDLKKDGIIKRPQRLSAVTAEEALKGLDISNFSGLKGQHSIENLSFLLRVTPFLKQLEAELDYVDSIMNLCQRAIDHLRWLVLLIDEDAGAVLFEKAQDAVVFLQPYYHKSTQPEADAVAIGKDAYLGLMMEIYKMWALLYQWKFEVPKLARYALNELKLTLNGDYTGLAKNKANPARVYVLRKQFRALRLYDAGWIFEYTPVTQPDAEILKFQAQLKKAKPFHFKEQQMLEDYTDLNDLYTEGEETSGLELNIASHDYSEQVGYPLYQCWVPWQSYGMVFGFGNFVEELQELLLVNSVVPTDFNPPGPVDLGELETNINLTQHVNRTSFTVKHAYTSFVKLNNLIQQAVVMWDKFIHGENSEVIHTNVDHSLVYSVYRSLCHDRARAVQVNAFLFPKVRTTYSDVKEDSLVNFDFELEAWFVMAQSHALYQRFALLYFPLMVRMVSVLKKSMKPEKVNMLKLITKVSAKRAKEAQKKEDKNYDAPNKVVSLPQGDMIDVYIESLDQDEVFDAKLDLKQVRDMLQEMFEMASEDGILSLGSQQVQNEEILRAYRVLAQSTDSAKAQEELAKAQIFRDGWYATVGKENRQLVEYIASLFMAQKPEILTGELKTVFESYKKLRGLVKQHKAIANRLDKVREFKNKWEKSKNAEALQEFWESAKGIETQFPENVFEQYRVASQAPAMAKKEKTEDAKDRFNYNAYRRVYYLQIGNKLKAKQFEAEEWKSDKELKHIHDIILVDFPRLFQSQPDDRTQWITSFADLQKKALAAKKAKTPAGIKKTLDLIIELTKDALKQVRLAGDRFSSASELDWNQLAPLIGITTRIHAGRKTFRDEESKDEVQLALMEIERQPELKLDEELEIEGTEVRDTDYFPMVDTDQLDNDILRKAALPVKTVNAPPILPKMIKIPKILSTNNNNNNNNNNVQRADSLPPLENNNNNSLSLTPFVSTITVVEDEVTRLVRANDIAGLTSLANSNGQGHKAAEAWLAERSNAMFLDSNSPLISEDEEPNECDCEMKLRKK